MSEEAKYCICKQAATGDMVGCDHCTKWFHLPCVTLSSEDKARIQSYICPHCELVTGKQTKWKKRRPNKKGGANNTVKVEEERVDEAKRNSPKADARQPSTTNPSSPTETPAVRRSTRAKVKHNYSDLNDGIQVTSATKELTVVDYNKMLSKARSIKDAEVPRKVLGQDLTVEYLAENGFREPLIVESAEHLGMKMPPSSITVHRIEEVVGDRLVDVIEVPTQSEVVPKWNMKKWADYYHTPKEERRGTYNVISLEVSQTPLMEQLRSPDIVRKLDWIDTVWPLQLRLKKKYPQVQYYCLMSVEGSYTDFHIDFAGSSVWYHVLKGKKVFYLIPPTPTNLKKYSSWSSSYRQNKVFFGNQVEKCYEAHVCEGQTLFIPTGWIHAVYTPADSLVFGGNFLHGYNCRMQLEIFEIELSTHVPNKFRFPNFRSLMWYAASHYNELLKEGQHLNSFEQDSAKALVETLYEWLQLDMRENKQKAEVPHSMRPALMLRELATALHETYPDKTSNSLKLKIKKEGDMLRSVSNSAVHEALGGLELMVSAAEHMNHDESETKRRFGFDQILNGEDEPEDDKPAKASLSFIVNTDAANNNNDNNNNNHNTTTHTTTTTTFITNSNNHYPNNNNNNNKRRYTSDDEDYESEDDFDEIDDEIQTARNNKGDEEWEFVYMRKSNDGEGKKVMQFTSSTPTNNTSSRQSTNPSGLNKKTDPKKNMGVRARLNQKLIKMEKRRK